MTGTFSPGSTFAGYRIDSQIGRGGMGVVYRATDLSLERPVALKLVAPDLAEDERFRSRFLREPKLAASLDHPNVVPIYEAGERDGQLYLAMRYVEGTDLRQLIRAEGRLDPKRALKILEQIASALDAAHRRGLVHRDVKPANVLIDEDGHAYLTDFGITKELSASVATDTGQLVGTLDYIAPEQIRGEKVDGRSDQYALACVLYEVLGGEPPFRRASEAETLWAHMNDEPPKLERYKALEPVLRKALAKEKGDRYATCSELIEAAREAVGLAAPTTVRRTRRRRMPALMLRRWALIAAGLVLIAAVLAAALLASGDDDAEANLGQVGNGVAVIGASAEDVDEFVEFPTAPSNIAVGEGAVWVLNTQTESVARIDPKTKAVTKRFDVDGIPTDIAAGEGAVWVGVGDGDSGNITARVKRVDPATGEVTRTAKLPGIPDLGAFNWGFPGIVTGGGAVWASTPGDGVARIDPGTGKLDAIVKTPDGPLAAGPEGIWILEEGDQTGVTQIDPDTNKVAQHIEFGAQSTSGIAVGGGAIWVTAEKDGVVWRIDPGPNPVLRTIDVGAGATYIAYGEGAVWVANYVDGNVSRIDPRTNRVTDRIPIGAAQAIAAGAGSVWVSTAGGTQQGTLPGGACAPLDSGAGEPDVLIASDLPLQGPQGEAPRTMVEAIRNALRARDYRAGKFTVGYRSCDNSTRQTGNYENRRCAANANAYAHADDLVALIGPYNSGCAQIEIPILNRAPGGPLAMVGPTTTYPGLTRRAARPDPGEGLAGEPGIYYPTGVRNFVRVKPGDDLQAAAHAPFAKRLRIRSVYVVDDGSDFWRELVTAPFRRAARKVGLHVAGTLSFDQEAKSYDDLLTRIERSGADAVVLGADPYSGGARFLEALRERFGNRVTVLGSWVWSYAQQALEQAGSAARGVYAPGLDMPYAAFPNLTPAARQVARDFGGADSPYGVLEAAQAAELVLDAIARSDGTRGSVLNEVKATEVEDGILGDFGFDENGDITVAQIPMVRVTGRRSDDELPDDFAGAEIVSVINVPPDLAN